MNKSTKNQNINAKNPISMSNLLQPGIRRPLWICRTTRQVVILVRDKSGSMEDENKAEQATKATQELVRELARPVNKDGFYVAVVDFSEKANIVHSLRKATELDGGIKPIYPFLGTNITDGLAKALNFLEDSQKGTEEGVNYLRPVLLLFTDGIHNVGIEPNGIADDIKEIADLVTVAYGKDADVKLLKYLASTSQHFYKCRNGKELRQFLASVGETMTATLSSGINATEALSKINRTS